MKEHHKKESSMCEQKMASQEDAFYYFWLTFLNKIPIQKLQEGVRSFGSPKRLFEAREGELDWLTQVQRRQLLALQKDEHIPRLWEERLQKPYRFLSCKENGYPSGLLELNDMPFGIYYKGRLPSRNSPSVAVVGARNSTAYGAEFAYQIGKELGRHGIMVVSGLAVGIDAAAHRGCLDGGGYTFGILGCGIDRMYPKENHRLFLDMQERGGILTEYPPETKPLPYLFPRRNRLISAMADFILVVEAREKSGSLITTDFALEQGKDVGAVPGRPCDQLNMGCNRLIQQGAKCILSAEDVLEELEACTAWRKTIQNTEKINTDLGLAPKEKMVYSCLRLEPKFIDEILCQIELPVWEGIQILTELERKGVIKQNPHHYFYRVM